MFRNVVILSTIIGIALMVAQPVLATQPELGVPFTYDCVLWKEAFDPLPDRLQRDIFTAIGTVVFAGVVAVVDLKKMLGLPFDPKLVVIGFFGLGMAGVAGVGAVFALIWAAVGISLGRRFERIAQSQEQTPEQQTEVAT